MEDWLPRPPPPPGQVIGEVKRLPEGPRVVARVLRPVDGLHVAHYHHAMRLLRTFLAPGGP